jgi:hypothetical protein
LLERAKPLVQKYIKEFDWKSFSRSQQGAEKLFRNFGFPTRKQTFV